MKRFASGVTPSELVSHIDEIMTMKHRNDKMSFLSRQLNQLLIDENNF